MATSESVSGCAKVWEALLDLSVGSLGTGGAETFRYCLQNSSMPLTPLALRPFPSACGGERFDSIPHHPLLLGAAARLGRARGSCGLMSTGWARGGGARSFRGQGGKAATRSMLRMAAKGKDSWKIAAPGVSPVLTGSLNAFLSGYWDKAPTAGRAMEFLESQQVRKRELRITIRESQRPRNEGRPQGRAEWHTLRLVGPPPGRR